MSALDRLIEAVEAGKFDVPPGEAEGPYIDDFDFYWLAVVTDRVGTIHLAWPAYNGSMDSALRLFEALLPGVKQWSIVTDPTCLKATVCCWPNGLSQEPEVYAESYSIGQPARALLICTLKAHRDTRKGDEDGPIE